MIRLGDAFSYVATPVARLIGSPCVDSVTGQLRPDSPCAKHKNYWNDFSDRLSNFFVVPSPIMDQQSGEETYFVITKQISVKASSIEDAIAKEKEGTTVAVSVTIQPTGTQPRR